MKQFVFDRLVDRENICNLDDEQQALRQAVQRSARVVVYGPRNFGKTSVVHNVTIEEFRGAHRRSFVFAADLLGVRSMRSLTQRMAASLQRCFAASFPVKGLLENAGRFLGSLRPEITLDPQTGSPSLSLHPGDAEPSRTLQTLWDQMRAGRLIVLDVPGRGVRRRGPGTDALLSGSTRQRAHRAPRFQEAHAGRPLCGARRSR